MSHHVVPLLVVGLVCACVHETRRAAPQATPAALVKAHSGVKRPSAAASEPPAAPPLVCHAQSPINILTRELQHHSATQAAVKLHYASTEESIVNLGHTIEVDFAPGSTVEFDGITYDFRQFHVHTPAEHRVDGVTYPMELHMVHTAHGDPDRYLVIALLFKDGTPSPFLADFAAATPTRVGERRREGAGTVDITTVLSPMEAYFHYRGSLTTPPYTESVEWLVAEQPRTASEAQIAFFEGIEGHNARAVQSRNGRRVDELGQP